LKRAARHLSPYLSLRGRVELLIHYVQQQGLGPPDFARAGGEDALVAIAQALPGRGLAIDTETGALLRRFCVDSFGVDSWASEIATRGSLPVPKKTLSPDWQRVLNHAFSVPR
jgi:hypothetical protein